MARAAREGIPGDARARLTIAAAVALGVGAYGWALFALSFRHDGLIGPRFNAPGVDFMVFWQGARAALAGDLGLLFDGARFTDAINAAFAPWLTGPLPFHPWIYPPSYLLLALPFGLLSFGWAYGLAMALSFAALVVAAVGREREWRRKIIGGALLLAPASSLDVLVGQNAFLTGALLIGGFRLLPKSPVLAGILWGALTLKPQLVLMAPVALVASRQWRALAAAAATALMLVLASAVAFGPAVWRDWFGLMLDPHNATHAAWSELSLLWGDSVYSCAFLLGAGPVAAAAAQALAALVGVAAVAHAFARPMPADLRLGVLLAGTVLAAPHVASYDLVLLAAAAALLLCHAAERGFGRFDLALALVLWLAPLYGPPHLGAAGFAMPVAAVLFLVSCGRRGGAAGTSASSRIS